MTRTVLFVILLAVVIVPGVLTAYRLAFSPSSDRIMAPGKSGEILQDRNGVPTWVKP